MLRCSRCGNDNEVTARFCVSCGNPLSAAAPPTPPDVTFGPAPRAPDSPLPDTAAGFAAAPPEALRPEARPSGTPAGPRLNETRPAVLPEALPGPPEDGFAYAETAPPAAGENLFAGPLPRRSRGPSLQELEDAAGSPPAHEPPPAGPSAASPLDLPADAPRVLCGFLVGYETNALGQFWPLYQGRNLIGRLGAMAGADVEIPHPTVSSRHATLFATAPPCRAILVDIGSTNGCFVNDTPLQPNQPRELRDGDHLRFGLYNVIVKTV